MREVKLELNKWKARGGRYVMELKGADGKGMRMLSVSRSSCGPRMAQCE